MAAMSSWGGGTMKPPRSGGIFKGEDGDWSAEALCSLPPPAFPPLPPVPPLCPPPTLPVVFLSTEVVMISQKPYEDFPVRGVQVPPSGEGEVVGFS